MKKITTIMMAVVFALALGMVYTADSIAMDNGITVFSSEPVSSLTHIDELAMDNGITLFALNSVKTGLDYKGEAVEIRWEEGSAAGGYEPGMDLDNGVTIFDSHAVEAD